MFFSVNVVLSLLLLGWLFSVSVLFIVSVSCCVIVRLSFVLLVL